MPAGQDERGFGCSPGAAASDARGVISAAEAGAAFRARGVVLNAARDVWRGDADICRELRAEARRRHDRQIIVGFGLCGYLKTPKERTRDFKETGALAGLGNLFWKSGRLELSRDWNWERELKISRGAEMCRLRSLAVPCNVRAGDDNTSSNIINQEISRNRKPLSRVRNEQIVIPALN